jgi:hypothetical protein
MAEIFVETVLMNELGEKIALDPGFSALKARVTADLFADDEIARDLMSLLENYSVSGSVVGK